VKGRSSWKGGVVPGDCCFLCCRATLPIITNYKWLSSQPPPPSIKMSILSFPFNIPFHSYQHVYPFTIIWAYFIPFKVTLLPIEIYILSPSTWFSLQQIYLCFLPKSIRSFLSDYISLLSYKKVYPSLIQYVSYKHQYTRPLKIC
jgi:hypothetical protein